jgi:hypothetical protein
MASNSRLRGIRRVGTTLAIYSVKATFLISRRTVMKFETLMLPSLFAVCSLVCVLTFGAMLI